MLQYLYNLFQIELVRFVEGIEISAVDVEDSDDLVVTDDGNNDLAIGSGRARNMSGEVMDVGYDDGFGALPSCAADTFTIRNARTRDRTLERTQDQLLPFYAIESCPPKAESVVQDCCHVRHVGNRV